MKNSTIKTAARASGAFAAFLVYAICPVMTKAETITLTFGTAFIVWMFTIGFLAAIRDFRRELKANERNRRPCQFYNIELARQKKEEEHS